MMMMRMMKGDEDGSFDQFDERCVERNEREREKERESK